MLTFFAESNASANEKHTDRLKNLSELCVRKD